MSGIANYSKQGYRLLKKLFIWKLHIMYSTGKLMYFSKIAKVPHTPMELFKQIVGKMEKSFLQMNLANVDIKYGVVGRVVTYRGYTTDKPEHIVFSTHKCAMKYKSIKLCPKVALTLVVNLPEGLWQIRAYDALAFELEREEVKKLWKKEPMYAKLRNIICESSRKNEGVDDLDRQYDTLLKRLEKERREPEQTDTYTAFKVIPKQWEFYFTEKNKIADRVKYILKKGEKNKWDISHIDA